MEPNKLHVPLLDVPGQKRERERRGGLVNSHREGRDGSEEAGGCSGRVRSRASAGRGPRPESAGSGAGGQRRPRPGSARCGARAGLDKGPTLQAPFLEDLGGTAEKKLGMAPAASSRHSASASGAEDDEVYDIREHRERIEC